MMREREREMEREVYFQSDGVNIVNSTTPTKVANDAVLVLLHS